MPHDPEDVISFAMREHARLSAELEAERAEVRRLKVMMIDVWRTLKEIELNLQKAVDKDA